ncbi:MAG: TPM domain-containing protein [Ignavibacteriaceae bacterium]|nr:TPM domain-containing protein [Ignavibacteriaceae bacterium]
MKFIFIIFLFTAVAFAQPQVPTLTKWATDLTGTFSEQQLNTLNSRLSTFEDTTSNQVLLLMISSLNGAVIEEYAYDVATKNKIGSKKFDNGALLLIAKADKKLRIEVGYGLEGILPDALSSSIIRNVIVPHFKRDEYYSGVSAGIDAIISAVKGEYKADPDTNDEDGDSIIPVIIFILFIIFITFVKGGRRGRGGFISYGSGLGGSSWGGSSGGSSFGGFSGGGGSFGGGGASGSW